MNRQRKGEENGIHSLFPSALNAICKRKHRSPGHTFFIINQFNLTRYLLYIRIMYMDMHMRSLNKMFAFQFYSLKIVGECAYFSCAVHFFDFVAFSASAVVCSGLTF